MATSYTLYRRYRSQPWTARHTKIQWTIPKKSISKTDTPPYLDIQNSLSKALLLSLAFLKTGLCNKVSVRPKSMGCRGRDVFSFKTKTGFFSLGSFFCIRKIDKPNEAGVFSKFLLADVHHQNLASHLFSNYARKTLWLGTTTAYNKFGANSNFLQLLHLETIGFYFFEFSELSDRYSVRRCSIPVSIFFPSRCPDTTRGARQQQQNYKLRIILSLACKMEIVPFIKIPSSISSVGVRVPVAKDCFCTCVTHPRYAIARLRPDQNQNYRS